MRVRSQVVHGVGRPTGHVVDPEQLHPVGEVALAEHLAELGVHALVDRSLVGLAGALGEGEQVRPADGLAEPHPELGGEGLEEHAPPVARVVALQPRPGGHAAAAVLEARPLVDEHRR